MRANWVGRVAEREVQDLPPLLVAADRGDVAELKALIRQGHDVNASTPSDGFTAAHTAALRGNADVLATLSNFATAFDFNAAAHCQSTPAFVASQNNQPASLRALIDAGADINKSATGGSTPAITAAWNGHIRCLEMLIASRCDIGKADDNGATPALACTFNGHDECLKALLLGGADLDAADNEGSTPAIIAAWNGHSTCLATLAAAGADLHRADNDGCTPALISLKGQRDGDLGCQVRYSTYSTYRAKFISVVVASHKTVGTLAAWNSHACTLRTGTWLGARQC
jgi:cytohesin